jgi:superfamily II DNA or RNA helicase
VDEHLIPAEPILVRRMMAQAVLDTPAIAMAQGEVCLASHQVDAASRVLALLDEWGGAVLADATGLGKTFVAIAVARLHAPSLIVAPAGLRGMWRESLGRAGVVARVESYEALSRGCTVGAPRPTLVVLDEAHHARNPKARRYAALADLTWGAHVLLLTATPVHNRGTDLRALIALFLGSRANAMPDDEVQRVIVRRTPEQVTDSSNAALPSVAKPRWVDVPGDPDTLRAIAALPPGVPAADGAAAHALLLLGLIRAWSSSEAALRATLRRRLQRAAALDAILESGRLPDRRELAASPIVDGAIQLGFPELFAGGTERMIDVTLLRTALDAHVGGVRSILRSLDRNQSATDHARSAALRAIRDRSRPVPIVAFTQFVDTAIATYQRCARDGGVVLVTGRGARVSSGHVTVDEVVRGFDVDHDGLAPTTAMPLELLVASDVLSEGISLRRAGVLVHLDLPWTMARLEQRVGRLRRLGSRHTRIEIYSIGPPVSARELVPVMRALQRKAQLAITVVGDSELRSSLPLLGLRLVRATTLLTRGDGSSTTERLRRALHRWADGHECQTMGGFSHCDGIFALALISGAGRQTLVAVTDRGVTGDSGMVLDAVELFTAASGGRASGSLSDAIAKVTAWLEEQRGRDLVHLALESPSSVHATILRMLQDRLLRATRTERATLGPRIEKARRAVFAARGIGVENALGRFTAPHLDLDRLERLLSSRAQVGRVPANPRRLEAILCSDARHNGAVRAYVASPETASDMAFGPDVLQEVASP